jgi:hypothetical protein
MALMQLMAGNGAHNKMVENFDQRNKVPNLGRTSIENVELEFFNGHLTIPRKSDLVKPTHLVANAEVERLDLEINGQKIMSLPLNFLSKLSGKPFEKEVLEDETVEYTYYIPWEYISKYSIIMTGLSYSEVIFYLDKQSTKAYLLCEQQYLDSEMRQKITCNIDTFIHQIFYEQIDFGTNTIIRRRLDMNGLSTGFFIEGLDIKNIENLRITINAHDRLNYNQRLLKTCCDKITDDLFYISLNNTKWNKYNYDSCLNLSRIDNVSIVFTLKTPLITDDEYSANSIVSIYNIAPNMLLYMDGMAACSFSVGSFASRVYRIIEQILKAKLAEETECIISYEKIPENGKYKKCTHCKNCFSKDQIDTYFQDQTNKKCPYCTNVWVDNKVYVNSN